jgi:hypothetical protein
MIVTAHTYLRQLQRLLREQKQEFSNPEDLLSYINLARREVAGRTQCIRRLTPISGQIISASVLTGGTGYVNPVATISTPDWPSGKLPNPNGRQATVSVEKTGTTVTGVTVLDGGDGYFQPINPIIITDASGPGTGATASLQLSPINTLNQGQETYAFSDIDVTGWPGVDVVHCIKSVSIVYSLYRYSLPVYAFSVYQSSIRQYSSATYQWVPAFGTQFGQGADGQFLFYPVPSQQLQLEFDCFCLPQDMTLDNGIPETIPQPWTDAVQYMAGQLAFQELQQFNAANYYEQQFDKRTLGYSTAARPGRAVNPYGRY